MRGTPCPDLTLGNAGVDLFFVISGFVMVYASERMFGRAGGQLQFITRRLIRIVPLYWLVTPLYLVMALAIPAFEKSYSVASVVASYLFIPWPRLDGIMQPLVGQGWTLNYEMFFYAIFAAAILAPRRIAVALASGVLIVAVGPANCIRRHRRSWRSGPNRLCSNSCSGWPSGWPTGKTSGCQSRSRC